MTLASDPDSLFALRSVGDTAQYIVRNRSCCRSVWFGYRDHVSSRPRSLSFLEANATEGGSARTSDLSAKQARLPEADPVGLSTSVSACCPAKGKCPGKVPGRIFTILESRKSVVGTDDARYSGKYAWADSGVSWSRKIQLGSTLHAAVVNPDWNPYADIHNANRLLLEMGS